MFWYQLSFWLVMASLVAMCASCANNETEEFQQPNILFAIADDASFPHMSAYGTKWVNTPGFDRVAENGLLFMKAYTPNAKCAPSRSCILTGRNSWQLEAAANHVPYFPAKFTTFMETLKDKGYHTGHTAKGWAPGDVGELNGKTRELTGLAYNKYSLKAPTSKINSNDYARNFEDFLDQNTSGQPFCFWYGSTEPHRAYEFRSGIKQGGKSLEDIDRVPAFWPDTDTVRSDILDYAFEIEHFDMHLQKMLNLLEERGELDNTIIVVTADNGMPFPRVKGQKYEYSNHLPLAIMWKKGINKPGRKISDFVSFIDFAPTFLEVAGISPESTTMQSITGNSLSNIFKSEKDGQVEKSRNSVLIGKERHDVGRPNDWGYPIRGLVTENYLYLHNFETERWPAGNPETGYLNTDGSPTKSQILNMRNKVDSLNHYWKMNFGKRPQEELFHIGNDPACIQNLALHPEYQKIKENLKAHLFQKLKMQDDPRMKGEGDLFDNYEYAHSNSKNFYQRYMQGEDVKAAWVNASDFQTETYQTE